MKYQVQENCLTIFLPNELDHHNAEDIRKNADALIEQHQIKCVIFDFSDTNFMDSSGIGMIVGRYKLVKPLGGKIILSQVKGNIERIISVSGLSKLLK